jgi:phenylpropionate dioxygenase-like ring-hydroxylating dioxygenase large terminal subunit
VSHKTSGFALGRSARWLLSGIAVVAIVAVSMYLLLRASDNALGSLNEAKKVRTTTAVVKAKEYIRFDQQNQTYVNNFGETVQVSPGTEQWRVYYQIDNFEQVLEPKRTELQRSEDARIKQFGFRFYPSSTPDKSVFDNAQVGDRLEVRYRYIGDEKEIVSIRNLTHPDS